MYLPYFGAQLRVLAPEFFLLEYQRTQIKVIVQISLQQESILRRNPKNNKGYTKKGVQCTV